MASLSSVNSDEIIFRNLYQRVVDRTGIKMKGYVAVQRKLLVLIYTLWKKDMEFDPNYEISGIQESEPLFSVAPDGAENKTAESDDTAALDGLPYNQSTEALFSV